MEGILCFSSSFYYDFFIASFNLSRIPILFPYKLNVAKLVFVIYSKFNIFFYLLVLISRESRL